MVIMPAFRPDPAQAQARASFDSGADGLRVAVSLAQLRSGSSSVKVG